MKLEKIRKLCLAAGGALIVHADSGDWLGNGRAMYFADSMRISEDAVTTMFDLKQKDNLLIQETQAEAFQTMTEADWSDTQEDDEPMELQTTVDLPGYGRQRIYSTGGDRPVVTILPEEECKAAERRDGADFCLRSVTPIRVLVSVNTGFLTQALIAGENIASDACPKTEALRKWLDMVAELVTEREAGHDPAAE